MNYVTAKGQAGDSNFISCQHFHFTCKHSDANPSLLYRGILLPYIYVVERILYCLVKHLVHHLDTTYAAVTKHGFDAIFVDTSVFIQLRTVMTS